MALLVKRPYLIVCDSAETISHGQYLALIQLAEFRVWPLRRI